MEQKIETNQGLFVIRPFEEGDEEGVLSLWRAAFGRELPRDVWRWKYMDNPFGRLFMVCVTEDGLPVAACSSFPYRARWNGRDVLLAHVVDSMSHPGYRGSVGGKKGLFVRTVRRFLDDYAGPDSAVFVYGFPGERHFKLGRMMLSYDRLPRGILYLRTSTGDLRPVRRRFAAKIEPALQAGEAFSELARRAERCFPFAVTRDASFLKWRFFDHPKNTYRVWTYGSRFRKGIQGYAVVHIEGDRARLLDWFLMDGKDPARDFAARLGFELRNEGVSFIETWLPRGHFLAEGLLSCGFREEPEPTGIVPAAVSRSFHPELPYQWAAEHLFFTMADGDLF